ncbi:hypothetical protein [Streptomyces albidoflavus]|uniref:hypothetical protein n=2 Tax=Streptomyces albidoflavus TaxID=1886 RepID=UPI00047531D8|nr:hypothetical protein [Streptomyces albidoflavus]RZD74798.1 hypothetical protein C0Q61_21470 [Streptomyces albidoflavus]
MSVLVPGRLGGALKAAAVVLGATLLVGGCGTGEEPDAKPTSAESAGPSKDTEGPSESPDDSSPMASVKSNGIEMVVVSALREEGGFVTISGTVTNNTQGRWIGAEWIGDERELEGNGGSLAGASLMDGDGKKRYMILRDTEGRCLCTKFQGGVARGNTVEWFAQFPAPPTGTDKVQLQVPTMPPATIQISEG